MPSSFKYDSFDSLLKKKSPFGHLPQQAEFDNDNNFLKKTSLQ